VGLAQAAALVPGTSRSGITMTAALALGFDRPTAARFSFLLAIPVGVLATAWDVLRMVRQGGAGEELAPMLVGLVGAAVAAYLVIGALLAWLRRQTMTPFVVYRVVLGLVLFALVVGGVIPALPPAPR
jgi:undecaprenyl-diphosphatase